MEEQICNKCELPKPITEFRKRHNRPSRHKYCKTCEVLDVKRRQDAKREDVLTKKRARYWANRETMLQRKSVYTEKHIEAIRQTARERLTDPRSIARRILQNAIKRGDIHKPGFCEDCKEEVLSRNLHGHHRDYLKPLEVMWLCRKCHGKVHRVSI